MSKITCPSCNASLRVADHLNGKTIRCPSCKEKFVVPDVEAFQAVSVDGLGNLIRHPSSLIEISRASDRQELSTEPQLEDSPDVSRIPLTLLTKIRMDYEDALGVIDRDVRELVESGCEMKAARLYLMKSTEIDEIAESLSNMFWAIVTARPMLEHYGSERLRQLGHPLNDAYVTCGIKLTDEMREPLERCLRKAEFSRNHAFLDNIRLAQIDYFLDTLEILIEPDFVPFQEATNDPCPGSESGQHIPSIVKLNVWRRDLGKCVQCGSRDKLQYAYVIPIEKGGSNTDRNVQLMCDKCIRLRGS